MNTEGIYFLVIFGWPVILVPILGVARSIGEPAMSEDERLGRALKSFFRGLAAGLIVFVGGWIWIIAGAFLLTLAFGFVISGGSMEPVLPSWVYLFVFMSVLVFANFVAFRFRNVREWIFEFMN